jgi:diguanylate cyclase (GGDEF)-like protein
MIPLDPMSGYALSGVSSLLGGSLLWLITLDDKGLRLTLRNCSLALLLLGASLGQLLFQGGRLGVWSEGLMLVGSAAAVPLLAAALAALSGVRAISMTTMGVAALAMALAQAFATARAGPSAGVLYAWLSSVAALFLLVACWPLIRRPRNFAESALGLSAVVYALSWLPRLWGAMTWDGPRLPHHLYLPETWWSTYGIFYAVLPLTMVALILSVAALRLHDQLKTRASTDELTGLLMRRALHETALELVQASRESGEGMAVLLCDIDHFKRINDSHGHAQGDSVLRHVAQVMRSQLRPDALLARYGGEEFVVVLRADEVSMARQVAERLRLAVATSPLVRASGELLSVTMSIGVAVLAYDDSLERALGRADEALYRAKNAGRDRVEVAIAVASNF